MPSGSWTVIACLLPVQQGEPLTRTIQAEEFVLKDSSGRVRARLGMKNDQSNLEFYDEKGSLVWTMPNKGFRPVESR